jgi:hypothetical protein
VKAKQPGRRRREAVAREMVDVAPAAAADDPALSRLQLSLQRAFDMWLGREKVQGSE